MVGGASRIGGDGGGEIAVTLARTGGVISVGGLVGDVGGRCGSCTPVGGALRARRGGNGGKRRPHAWHTASSSAFSALQNGQNRMVSRRSADQVVRPIAR